jgi:outer membrane protein OmpA-like peptidoglycan-associated protein
MFNNQSEDHWIPLADLMTGLMLVFLLLAFSYMLIAQQKERKIREIAVSYQQIKLNLYQDLIKEFSKDLPQWHAHIYESDLSIHFYDPQTLFATGKTDITPRFTGILGDFFPRYIKILTQPKYSNYIDEVRVQGYSSSAWKQAKNPDEAFLNNMKLSENRSLSVLNYVYMLPSLSASREFLKGHLTANGLSSSRPVVVNGNEDPQQSQRIEFKVLLNSDNQIQRILTIK